LGQGSGLLGFEHDEVRVAHRDSVSSYALFSGGDGLIEVTSYIGSTHGDFEPGLVLVGQRDLPHLCAAGRRRERQRSAAVPVSVFEQAPSYTSEAIPTCLWPGTIGIPDRDGCSQALCAAICLSDDQDSIGPDSPSSVAELLHLFETDFWAGRGCSDDDKIIAAALHLVEREHLGLS